MTKRDKFPPLKPHQKDIVQKHAYRKWLKENGTPYDKSRYEFIQNTVFTKVILTSTKNNLSHP